MAILSFSNMLISYKGNDQSENSFFYEEILNINFHDSRNVNVKRTQEFFFPNKLNHFT